MTTDSPSNTTERDPFEDLYSKVRRIYIPLPGFRFFHRPSEVNDVDSQFVGRQRILGLLKNWLEDKKDNRTGSYLITGYRGMGKTSFVSKAIDDLINEQDKRGDRKKKLRKIWDNFYPYAIGIILAVPSVALIFRLVLKSHSTNFWKYLVAYVVLCIIVASFWKILFLDNKKYILKIKVNVGNEVCEIKDVLSLLAYSLRNRFREYIVEKMPVLPNMVVMRLLTWTAIPLIVYAFFQYIMGLLRPAGTVFFSSGNDSLLFHIIGFINDVLYNLTIAHPVLAAALGIVALVPIACLLWTTFLRIVFWIFNYLGKPVLRPTTILDALENLCNRIDASVREDNDPYDVKVSAFSLILKHKSSRNYEPASVREIEQTLTEVIEMIDASKILNCRLIVILDEMDKLNKENPSEKPRPSDFPEFASSENGVTDEATQHEKSHKILSLLGQFKYFISTAKAKFIFIAGHELYDAYLADVSDREYSISSIFNGVINVDSFFTCNSRTKDITRLTEAFVCKHLMKDKKEKNKKEKDKEEKNKEEKNKEEKNKEEKNKKGAEATKEEASKAEAEGKDQTECWEADAEKFNLKKYWEQIGKNKEPLSEQERLQQEKIFIFLRQFITYLTFVSNGAPKKLTAHFEKYIISREVYILQNNLKKKNGLLSSILHIVCGRNIFEKKRRCRVAESITLNEQIVFSRKYAPEYYLSFGYHDQQKIGFIHYMANPIFENIISPSSEYGDKLLIASSFLIAHIYKHHSSGFSWRNLEYLPELIDSNRTPELRDYINSIIGYLAQIHLTSITSGIYTYKFPMRLVEEISIFTKKSEELSAIFNFSLDYSLAVKKYYYRLLDFYRTRQGGSEVVKASLHHNLGDIHLSNDEYTEAIVQFRLTADSIETQMRKLRKNPKENLSSLIVRYTRVMLKLGLAYEKRNTMDSAYLVYSNLTTKLIAHREIDEHDLNLEYKIDKEPADSYWQGKRVILFKPEMSCSIDKFCRNCYPAPYNKIEDQQVKYWIYGDELTDNLCDFLSSKKEMMITMLSVFEDLRVAYLPILAKLFALEKHNICGITRDNVKVADSEFHYLFLITNSKDKYLLCVDFYRKLGDILYYKNRYFYENEPDSTIALFACWGFDLKNTVFDRCYREGRNKADIESIMNLFWKPLGYEKVKTWDEFRNLVAVDASEYNRALVFRILDDIPSGMQGRIDSILECGCRRKKVKNTPCFACRYYNRSLQLLRDKLLHKNPTKFNKNTSKVFLFLDAILSPNDEPILSRYNELTQVALTLESMGNALLSCSSKKDRINNVFLSSLFFSNINSLIILQDHIGHLEKALLYYWTAMKYHSKASNHKESVHCLLKILKVLSSYMSLQRRIGGYLSVLNPMQKAVIEAIHGVYISRDFYNIKEAKKLKYLVDGPINLGLTSVMPEVEELLMAYYEIVLNQISVSNKRNYRRLLRSFYGSPSLSYLRNDSLIYNRVISLLFKAKLNARMMRELGFDLMSPPTADVTTKNSPSQALSKNGVKGSVVFETLHNDSETNKLHEVIQDCMGREGSIRDALEFLIADSIFCLTNITDFILPTVRTTLFTNSFCQSVYMRLYYWVVWKEAYVEACKGSNLEKTIEQLVESHNLEILKPTFLREMANKYSAAAREMHSEGEEYQEFIKTFYLLDDDLQNNTCQFFFALERFKINSDGLKEIAAENKGTTYYDPEQYFLWPKR